MQGRIHTIGLLMGQANNVSLHAQVSGIRPAHILCLQDMKIQYLKQPYRQCSKIEQCAKYPFLMLAACDFLRVFNRVLTVAVYYSKGLYIVVRAECIHNISTIGLHLIS
jgi:hypothetical protein